MMKVVCASHLLHLLRFQSSCEKEEEYVKNCIV